MTTAGHTRLVIVGATGMVGGDALHYALDRTAVGRVTPIGRRELGLSHPKLDEALHRDFADCSPLANVLSEQDGAVFCLGTYTGAVREYSAIIVPTPPSPSLVETARTRRGEAGWHSHAIRDMLRTRFSRWVSHAPMSSAPLTFTP